MIRAARPDDVSEIHVMVCELAVFEKLRHLVRSTPDDLHAALFGERPLLEALVAEDEAGRLLGFALFFPTFSSFTGRPSLWLEDVYVRPEARGKGLGGGLFDRFVETARERGCGRAEWSVLDWNTHAIAFYEQRGASVLPDWRIGRIAFETD